MNEFEGKGFIVVGDLTPFAREAVLLAAERGASVVFAIPPGSEAEGKQVLAEARARGLLERVCGMPSRLAPEAGIEQFMDEAVERLPGFHVLVHDLSGRSPSATRGLLDTRLDDWNEMLDRRLRVPFLVSRRAILEFLAGGEGGELVYVASHARADREEGVALLSGRTALDGLVRSIAKEYGRRNIRCNAVYIAQAVEHASRDRVRGDEGVAEAVLFLASRESAYMNGAVIPVNG